ncbi:hypothetical protein IFR04_011915 [Cadophora malorum]|uniref:HMG box domain-containing protein n=1 Tax=Cadophora malorum TaxID=108018 RepID=A0A8H7T9T6_9HELO|nr:hypothetical protein IFR04_011915 [Cadophora malorum]
MTGLGTIFTELDFDALGVKLGHRRKLQRRIANSRGLPSERALGSPGKTPSDNREPGGQNADSAKAENKNRSGALHRTKRKYRRHPKPSENAPRKPPSAYVIFSNRMREELQGRNLSFTEIAKLAGENWRNLSPAEKEPFNQQAFLAKERYNNELAEYKKTDSYEEYLQYLAEFKARHSAPKQANDSKAGKRPKPEVHISTTGVGMSSSTMSQAGGNTSNNRMAAEKSAANSGQWYSADGQPTPQVLVKPKTNIALAGQGSPRATSPMVLPRYHHSILGGTCQVLPWGEGPGSLQQLPRTEGVGDRRSSYTGEPVTETPNLTDLQEYSQAPGQSYPPPLSTSNSKNGSSASWVSTGPSALRTLQPPVDLPLERALPNLLRYSKQSSHTLENQLSAKSIYATVNFPASVLPIRDYVGAASQQAAQGGLSDCRTQEFVFLRSADDHDLDPVSALLKAGEIIERNSRHRSGS